MENTKIFGLYLIFFVLQFTDRSFVNGYLFKFSQGPPILANGMTPDQVRSETDPNVLVRSIQNVNKTKNGDIDIAKQRVKFKDNLKMFTEPMDYIKHAAVMVILEYPDNEPKNYIKLVSALDMLANATRCNPSILNDTFAYNEIVSLAMDEVNLAPKIVASRVLGMIGDGESKIQGIKSTIHTTSTNCSNSTTEICNEHIYRTVIRSDIFSSEAIILAKYAELAKYYKLHYHDEFIIVSKTNQVYSYLLKSLDHLAPLVRNIVTTRWIAGIEVQC